MGTWWPVVGYICACIPLDMLESRNSFTYMRIYTSTYVHAVRCFDLIFDKIPGIFRARYARNLVLIWRIRTRYRVVPGTWYGIVGDRWDNAWVYFPPMQYHQYFVYPIEAFIASKTVCYFTRKKI